MTKTIAERVDQEFDRLVEIRHELHAHPELGYQEHETSRRIVGWLGEMEGVEVRTGLARGTGVLATLDSGRPGPTVVLRADIDALPIVEQSGLPWASTNDGVMHACGHDGHTTCLLGAASVLSKMRDELTGRVRFMFQPAEESGGGAVGMIADGSLDEEGRPVDAVFGLHGWPGRKIGEVATRPGPLMASTDSFLVIVHGKGSHGAYPHIGVDPIVAAGGIVMALQTVVSRRLDPLASGVVTVGKIHAGTAINIVPETAELSGTIRSLDPEVRKQLCEEVERVILETAAAFGCRAEAKVGGGYPVTINNHAMCDLVARTAREALGEENFDPDQPPSMGGEDFSYYLEKVPGCFFFIGTCPRDRDEYPSIHTPLYDFTDEAIRVGVRMHCELVRRFGQEHGGQSA